MNAVNEEVILESVIIGSGPAGMSAAIYLKRFNKQFVLLSKNKGGQMYDSGLVENFASYNSITGRDLTNNMVKHMEYLGVEVIYDDIVNISKNVDHFIVHGQKTWRTKTVLLCCGSSYKCLNIEGESELTNKGVCYCVSCDAYFFLNRPVVVIGGGNSALDAALTLFKVASSVTIINKNTNFKGDKMLLDKVLSYDIKVFNNALTQRIIGDNNVTGVQFCQNGENKIINTDGIFIKIGMIAHSHILRTNFPSVINNEGEIIIDAQNNTCVSGLFAAGDVTNVAYKQISIASGEGAKAAISINNFLNSLN